MVCGWMARGGNETYFEIESELERGKLKKTETINNGYEMSSFSRSEVSFPYSNPFHLFRTPLKK
jgi:hypothetical protein